MAGRKFLFYTALFFLIIAFYTLFTGSPILTIALDAGDSIPLGTFITWAGLIAIPLLIFLGTRKLRVPESSFHRFLSAVLKGVLLLALLWVPVCYLLAGNLAFNFSQTASFQGGQLAMMIFWYYSGGIVVMSVLILMVYWLSLFFTRNS